MRYPHLKLRRRSPRAAISVAVVAAAAFAGISAGEAPAGPRTASGAPADSALVHRLTTCLAPGQAKPTVVLVHGAWADASSWSREVALLQAAGYDVRAIANPLQNLTTDSEYVADYLKAIHRPVVLAGHSYGGSVITNAAARLANVKRLVYIDAAAPAPGQTTGQLSGADSVLTKMKPAELFYTTTAPAGTPELYLKESIFIHHFASDLPPSKAKVLWASQRGASTAAFDTPSKAAARRRKSYRPALVSPVNVNSAPVSGDLFSDAHNSLIAVSDSGRPMQPGPDGTNRPDLSTMSTARSVRPSHLPGHLVHQVPIHRAKRPASFWRRWIWFC
jgi:pimeloyl-ACP methyl ester carboxylesterase